MIVLLWVWVGLAIVHLIFAELVTGDYVQAFDRMYYQAFALIIAYIALRIERF